MSVSPLLALVVVTPVAATADLDLSVDQLLAAAFTLKATLPPARLTLHSHLDYDWPFNQVKVSSTLESIPLKFLTTHLLVAILVSLCVANP